MELFSIAIPVSQIKTQLINTVDEILKDVRLHSLPEFVDELKDKTNNWSIQDYTDQEMALLFPTEYREEFNKIVDQHEDGRAWTKLPHVVYDGEYVMFIGYDNCVLPFVTIAFGSVNICMEFFREGAVVHIRPIVVTPNDDYQAMLNKFEVTDELRELSPEMCEVFDAVVTKQKKSGLSAPAGTFFATGMAC